MRHNRIAVLALVVAVAGTVFALANSAIALPGRSTVNSGDIVNNSVRGVDVRESSLGIVPIAKSLGLLPSGKSQSGVFSGSGGSATAGYFWADANYVRALAVPIPNDHVMENPGGVPTANCPGVGRAAPGYFCIYRIESLNTGSVFGFSTDPGLPTPSVGVQLRFAIINSNSSIRGSWTVTAP